MRKFPFKRSFENKQIEFDETNPLSLCDRRESRATGWRPGLKVPSTASGEPAEGHGACPASLRCGGAGWCLSGVEGQHYKSYTGGLRLRSGTGISWPPIFPGRSFCCDHPVAPVKQCNTHKLEASWSCKSRAKSRGSLPDTTPKSRMTLLFAISTVGWRYSLKNNKTLKHSLTHSLSMN